jgi:hypothetical protein
MHFHLPKPLHGWRAFVGEVGIIVLGVLIALGAEQVAQTVHDRADAKQLSDALRGELSDDRARWESIRAQDRCTEQRLDVLDKWVVSAPASAIISRNPYPIMLWNMHSTAWDIAKTSPAVTRIPLEERLVYASLYGAVDNWRQFFNEEYANLDALVGLFATADQPQNRAQLRLHLAEARLFLRRRQRNYDYFFARFDELGIKPDTGQLNIPFDVNAACAPLRT